MGKKPQCAGIIIAKRRRKIPVVLKENDEQLDLRDGMGGCVENRFRGITRFPVENPALLPLVLLLIIVFAADGDSGNRDKLQM